jgi:phosphoenolpyruvate-protein phosphotransferase
MKSKKKIMTTRNIVGMPLVPGCASGNSFVVSRQSLARKAVEKKKVKDVDVEMRKCRTALGVVKKELDFLKDQAFAQLGEEEGAIFQIQSLILEDRDLLEDIEYRIQKKRETFEDAVLVVLDHYEAKFRGVKDRYLQDKFVDVKDVLLRMRNRSYIEEETKSLGRAKNQILVADQIFPSVFIPGLGKSFAAIVTVVGGLGSHAGILAKSFGIPAVGVEKSVIRKIKTGDPIMVDGQSGIVTLNPTDSMMKNCGRKQAKLKSCRTRVGRSAKRRVKSKDEVSLSVLANCGNPTDVVQARENGADGIGLFRTEFVFHDYARFPNEEEQFEIYKGVGKAFAKRTVTIRTLDLGADKSLPYFVLPKQINPYLGWRSLKISFDHPEQFKAQIKAILRAATLGNVRILFPMVNSYEDIVKCKEFVRDSKEDLKRQNKDFLEQTPIGAMIETPAAVARLEDIAPEVDFLSIGTNDLAQHILAVDRDNPRVSEFYIPHHPAVVSTLADIVRCAQKLKKPVTICGEMAQDPYYAQILLGLGLRQFSMVPNFIPLVKHVLRQMSTKKAGESFKRISQMKKAEDIMAHIYAEVDALCPEVDLLTVRKSGERYA